MRAEKELHRLTGLPCSTLERDLETVQENVVGARAAGDFEMARGARQMQGKLREEITRRKRAGEWNPDDGALPQLDDGDTDVYRSRPGRMAA
jgi:hypothetical protein